VVDLDLKQAVPESTPEPPRTAAIRSVTERLAASRSGFGADAAAIAQREFPAELQAREPPAGLWIVVDTSGRTLRKGTLSRGQSLGTVFTSLQREMPDRHLRAFEARDVPTAQGRSVLVGVSRAD
jgi:hypothetical protein